MEPVQFLARRARGQALPEFAVSAPVLVLLVVAFALGGYYAWRAAAADWGLYITGVSAGAYNSPRTDQARQSIIWDDIANGLTVHSSNPTGVRTDLSVRTRASGSGSGVLYRENHRGSAFFWLWRFRPGPPRSSDGGRPMP